MSLPPSSEVYGAANPSLFSGGHDQDVIRWLDKFKYFSQANSWDERKQYVMMPYYLTGKAKKWFEDNKEDLSNIEQLRLGLQEKYPPTHLPILEQLIINTNEGPLKFSIEKNKTKDKHITLPSTVVHKIKTNPPHSHVSDDFFKLCLVAACTKREVLMNYKNTHISANSMLDDYLFTHFANNGKLNFNSMNLIGNLLLCHVPDDYCDFILAYRQKLKANNIFESDIENSELSDIQKSIIKEKFEYFNIENSKLCGFIMNNFMIRCRYDSPLPDISFLNDSTTVLTDIEKVVFRAYKH